MAGTSLFCCSWALALLVLGPLDSDWNLRHQPFSSQGFRLGLKPTTSPPGSSPCRGQNRGTSLPPGTVSQLLIVSIYLLLVLFLWITLTNTPSLSKPQLCLLECDNHFQNLFSPLVPSNPLSNRLGKVRVWPPFYIVPCPHSQEEAEPGLKPSPVQCQTYSFLQGSPIRTFWNSAILEL